MIYGAGINDWKKDDLRQMDRNTRKMFTIYKSMHPRDDVNRLYWERLDGGRGLQSV